MGGSCKDIRDSIAECLLKSDCVQNGHPGNECLSDPALRATIPNECIMLLANFYDCKRGLLDMRRRFSAKPAYAIRPDEQEAIE